jgi:hypothetical protein
MPSLSASRRFLWESASEDRAAIRTPGRLRAQQGALATSSEIRSSIEVMLTERVYGDLPLARPEMCGAAFRYAAGSARPEAAS